MLGNTLCCPVCRTVHNRVHTFPQNMYIIAYMKRNNFFAKCKEHFDKELSLFCKAAGCQQPICQLCLIKGHLSHKVVDIVEEQKQNEEAIKNIADDLISKLTAAQSSLLKTKGCLEKKNGTALAVLKKRKTEAIQFFNIIIQIVSGQMNTSNEEVDQQLGIISRELKLVNGVKNGASRSYTTKRDLPNNLAIIQEIRDRVQTNVLSAERTFQYYKLNDTERAEAFGIDITSKAMKIQLSDAKKGRSDADTEGCPPTKKSRSQKSTSIIILEGMMFRIF